jgi:hypothetical protein
LNADLVTYAGERLGSISKGGRYRRLCTARAFFGLFKSIGRSRLEGGMENKEQCLVLAAARQRMLRFALVVWRGK